MEEISLMNGCKMKYIDCCKFVSFVLLKLCVLNVPTMTGYLFIYIKCDPFRPITFASSPVYICHTK